MRIKEIFTFGTMELSHFGEGTTSESLWHPHSEYLQEHGSIEPDLFTKHHFKMKDNIFHDAKSERCNIT